MQMVETIALVAGGVFIIGLLLGLVSTEFLRRGVKQSTNPSPTQQYSKKRSRR